MFVYGGCLDEMSYATLYRYDFGKIFYRLSFDISLSLSLSHSFFYLFVVSRYKGLNLGFGILFSTATRTWSLVEVEACPSPRYFAALCTCRGDVSFVLSSFSLHGQLYRYANNAF